MSTFKNKNSLRTIEAQIVQKLKNNEVRPKFTGSYKKERVLDIWGAMGSSPSFPPPKFVPSHVCVILTFLISISTSNVSCKVKCPKNS